MASVDRIEIHNIRGIPFLSFDLKGKGMVLLADNGMGKSSIVDSLEFFFTDNVKHLSRTMGIALQKHLPTVGTTWNDCAVELSFRTSSGFKKMKRSNGYGYSIPPELKDYFEQASLGNFILCRQEILDFINVQDADRYRIVARIMGIENLEEYQLALRQVKLTFDQELTSQQNVMGVTQSRLLTETGYDSKDKILNNLNSRLAKVGLGSHQTLGDLESETRNWFIRFSEESKRARCIRHLQVIFKELQEVKSTVHLLEKLWSDVGIDWPEEHHISFLAMGKRIIRETKEDHCPFCHQSIKSSNLVSIVDKELDAMNDAKQQYGHISNQREKLTGLLNRMEAELTAGKKEVESLKSCSTETARMSHLQTHLQRVIQSQMQKNDIQGIADEIERVSKQLIQDLSKQTPSDNDQEIMNVRDIAEKARPLLMKLDIDEQSLAKLREAQEDAAKIYDTYIRMSKAHVDAQFNRIRNDLARFYDFLHPGDPHANAEIGLREPTRASATLSLDSFGQGPSNPRAFASEGHLDSLGLCIFLAFVKTFNNACSLVILDDVVSSIDAGHRGRIADLLLDEFQDYQLIITTHDQVWAKNLSRKIVSRGLDSQFKKCEIISWTELEGPQLRLFTYDVSRIDEVLNLRYWTCAGARARVFLEGTLKRSCEFLRVEMPFRQDRRKQMVNTLLVPLEEKLIKILSSNSTNEAKDILRALENIESSSVWMNELVHDSVIRNKIGQSEAQEFCEAVKGLKSALCCRHCQSFLLYDSSRNTIQCKNAPEPNHTIIPLS